MRNAALVLGVIGGLLGMLVGFAGYGWTELVARHSGLAEAVGTFRDPDLVRWVGVLAPVMAIAGGAMARSRALWGGLMMLASAAAMYHAFGLGVFTVFPLAMTGLGGLLAIAAGKPDEPRAHF